MFVPLAQVLLVAMHHDQAVHGVRDLPGYAARGHRGQDPREHIDPAVHTGGDHPDASAREYEEQLGPGAAVVLQLHQLQPDHKSRPRVTREKHVIGRVIVHKYGGYLHPGDSPHGPNVPRRTRDDGHDLGYEAEELEYKYPQEGANRGTTCGPTIH